MERDPSPTVREPGAADQPAAPAPVGVETMLRLLAPDATGVPVRCGLHYDPADPYAVHVRFRLSSRSAETISWSFARELLAAGLDEPSGLGDVRIWPWRTPSGESVALALTSPDGQALLEAPRPALARFLAETYAVVPAGRESEMLEVDADGWLNDLGNPPGKDPDA